MHNPLLSICIPSYNRPTELISLLNSIEKNNYSKIEVVICEDRSPNRINIREQVNVFKVKNPDLNLAYYENDINYGYDRNLVELITKAKGDFIMFMGDDDFFVSGNLELYLDFIDKNQEISYFLRRYLVLHPNQIKEDFRYYTGHKYFEPGKSSFLSLFRKSVFISGFTFKRASALNFYNTNEFNGTLLYQLFICGELSLNYKTCYCDIPITQMDLGLRGTPEFGSSVNESSKYTPGTITFSNSINFMKSFIELSSYFDRKYKQNFSYEIKKDLSKYSFPILALHRNKGVKEFIRYNEILKKEININITFYYYIYFFSLLILNVPICNYFIFRIKKIIGKTPNL